MEEPLAVIVVLAVAEVDADEVEPEQALLARTENWVESGKS